MSGPNDLWHWQRIHIRYASMRVERVENLFGNRQEVEAMYTHILIPTDGSELSNNAIRIDGTKGQSGPKVSRAELQAKKNLPWPPPCVVVER